MITYRIAFRAVQYLNMRQSDLGMLSKLHCNGGHMASADSCKHAQGFPASVPDSVADATALAFWPYT